ncbi:hypothetical protein DBT_1107 [Dissulfuribacter thermophilus]|uniref:DUF1844 domain-containing protein n=1 Tax=Dissulfuribacter thermophilus TaxID=1156395 RepID=A0A1B9F625_9BACT|nr:DUF1844 domain-containing protein [Dissulfuribacter thermophilus]OCC15360.1 hypothetical protein DBT_1107 [Dissulfuribacter thermophilus]
MSEKAVLPEVTFTTFIMSLNTSCLVCLGELPEPSSGETKKDLACAKHTIDTLEMLKQKTKGNLEKEEEDLLSHILYDLKMRYVKALK